MEEGIDSVLLLPSDIGSYRRRSVYRWVIERLAEHFFAVYDIPGLRLRWHGLSRLRLPCPGPLRILLWRHAG